MRRLPERAPCGAALIAVLLLQPVVVSLCIAACGGEVSEAELEEPAASPSHCGAEESRPDADGHSCDGHARACPSTTAPRKASLADGGEVAVPHSLAYAEKLGIREILDRPYAVPHLSYAPPGRSVLRL